jgi:hypothetical protein
MVVIDATILLLVLKPGVGVPKGQNGKPVDRAVERVNYMISECDRGGIRVIVPTPALADALVGVPAKTAIQIVDQIESRYWSIKIVPFDQRAAIEVAAMSRDPRDKHPSRDRAATWAKLKYDRQVVAIAKVNGATTIYSDDRKLRALAAREGIQVLGVADLPLPPEEPSPEEVQPYKDALELPFPKTLQ